MKIILTLDDSIDRHEIDGMIEHFTNQPWCVYAEAVEEKHCGKCETKPKEAP